MDLTKIRLSEEEMELVCNANWILTKNQIIEKVKNIFCVLAERQKEIVLGCEKEIFPIEVISIPPKISKGENYKGLPYLILDFPRYFEKDNTFALRTMFWWGHYFSTTLHLSGRYKVKYEKNLLNQLNTLQNTALYVCVNENEWEHELDENNYQLVDNCNEKLWHSILQQKNFIKLSKENSLKDLGIQANIEDLLANHYLSLIAILGREDF